MADRIQHHAVRLTGQLDEVLMELLVIEQHIVRTDLVSELFNRCRNSTLGPCGRRDREACCDRKGTSKDTIPNHLTVSIPWDQIGRGRAHLL